MRHEVQYILTEAEMLKLFQERLDIPMPKLLFYDESRDICNVPYFFMSYLDGVPLCDDHGCSEGRGEEGNGRDHTKDLFFKGRYLWNSQYSGKLLQEKQ